MSLTEEQINDFYRLTSKERFGQFVAQVQEKKVVWTLANDQGCVLVDTGEEQCLLLWHDEDLAESWATEEYQGCRAMGIPLDDFLAKWVPGMAQDGFDVALVPTRAGEGEVMSPEELAGELTAE
ncbi:DUF2750 domain-containing protein [Ferrimonas sp. YFM]|uniref:DUF2750 domain-containing protein n=1 Tax=Ferrimonas sp. YFM TaxID=3028878 RepID=UPI002573E051|nr:DUF2750 domain-containing protein [Ferrimonas sp. YFM]BDY04095.1 DUF2750 domain-containing protein [Ferrimonas sp. YFM]